MSHCSDCFCKYKCTKCYKTHLMLMSPCYVYKKKLIMWIDTSESFWEEWHLFTTGYTGTTSMWTSTTKYIFFQIWHMLKKKKEASKINWWRLMSTNWTADLAGQGSVFSLMWLKINLMFSSVNTSLHFIQSDQIGIWFYILYLTLCDAEWDITWVHCNFRLVCDDWFSSTVKHVI